MADSIRELQVLLGNCWQALQYMARPTMGISITQDPAEFARHGATEENVRSALATVIYMAQTLKDRLEETGEAMEWVRAAIFDEDQQRRDRMALIERLAQTEESWGQTLEEASVPFDYASFFKKVQEYAETQMDQGEEWRISTSYGPVYITLLREWPMGDPENYVWDADIDENGEPARRQE